MTMDGPRPIPSADEIWGKYDAMEARLSAPLSERMLDLARIGPGMRVLDLATGRGEPAIPAGHRVGPSGFVLGVDSSAGMLAMAAQRATREGLTNVELLVRDAASPDGLPGSGFDATLARWGLMYMDSPVAALINARRAMVPGGVLVAAVWAEPERVQWFTLPRRVLQRYRGVPPVDFGSPGPFRYSATERLRRDLQQAAFHVQHVEELEGSVMEVETVEEAIDWVRAFGLTKLLNDLPEPAQRSWEDDFARELEGLRKDGFFRLGGLTRIVVAS